MKPLWYIFTKPANLWPDNPGPQRPPLTFSAQARIALRPRTGDGDAFTLVKGHPECYSPLQHGRNVRIDIEQVTRLVEERQCLVACSEAGS